MLPDTDEHGAFVIGRATAQRAARRVRAPTRCRSRSASASPATRAHGETAASLLRAADEALQAAKWSGRNRTMLHSPAMRSAPQRTASARDIDAERFLAVMLDLAEAVDLRFSGSARHSETVGRYAEMMARELGLSEQRDRAACGWPGCCTTSARSACPTASCTSPGG